MSIRTTLSTSASPDHRRRLLCRGG